LLPTEAYERDVAARSELQVNFGHFVAVDDNEQFLNEQ
jgi:hypothetical protein